MYKLIYENEIKWLEYVKPVDSMLMSDSENIEMEKIYLSKHIRAIFHPLFKIVEDSQGNVSLYQYDILGLKYECIDNVIEDIGDGESVDYLKELIDSRIYRTQKLSIRHTSAPKWKRVKGKGKESEQKITASFHLNFEQEGLFVPMYHIIEDKKHTDFELTSPFLQEEVYKTKINVTRIMYNMIREERENKPRGTYMWL